MKLGWLFSIFLISTIRILAQDPQFDSLQSIVRSNQPDTQKVKALNHLAGKYREIGEYEKADEFAQKALRLAEEKKYQQGISSSLKNIGFLHLLKSDYDKAMQAYARGLEIDKSIGDKMGEANSYTSIAIIYQNKSDYQKALEFALLSLRLKEELGDKKTLPAVLNNIGNIYIDLSEFDKALEYYHRSLELKKELNDKKGVSSAYINIGNAYMNKSDFEQALKYFYEGLEIVNQIKSKRHRTICLLNLGGVYVAKFKEDTAKKGITFIRNGKEEFIPHHALLDTALKVELQALQLCREMDDPFNATHSLEILGDISYESGKLEKAVDYYLKGYQLADSIEGIQEKMTFSKKIYQAYKESGNAKEALVWHEKHIEFRDTIFNADKQKAFGRLEAQALYDKELIERKKEAEKKEAIHKAELEQRAFERNAFIGGFALVLLLAAVSYRGYKAKKSANAILQAQNDEIIHQKNIIEVKNKDILDSIHYAKRIQNALLKEEDHVSLHLPSHFILFKPKDIISGDFYWSFEKNNNWYIAAADCTGHGVPGAMMSMLGIAFLNEIASDRELAGPAEILDELKQKVTAELSTKEGAARDGMDISLARVNLESKELQWAGANNPLWIYRGNELIEIKGDKQPIGYSEQTKNFTNQEIPLQSGDAFFLITDGFADQFGGPKGKKLKYKPLQEKLKELASESSTKQKEELSSYFEAWRGTYEQTDDVTVIGVKI